MIFILLFLFKHTKMEKQTLQKKHTHASRTEMVKDLCQEGIKANPRSSPPLI